MVSGSIEPKALWGVMTWHLLLITFKTITDGEDFLCVTVKSSAGVGVQPPAIPVHILSLNKVIRIRGKAEHVKVLGVFDFI